MRRSQRLPPLDNASVTMNELAPGLFFFFLFFFFFTEPLMWTGNDKAKTGHFVNGHHVQPRSAWAVTEGCLCAGVCAFQVFFLPLTCRSV